MLSRLVKFLIVAICAFCTLGFALADTFAGTFSADTSAGKAKLELKQTGKSVTGTYSVGSFHLTIQAEADGDKAVGIASVIGAEARFFIGLQLQGSKLSVVVADVNSEGQPDLANAKNMTLTKVDSSGSSWGKGQSSSMLDSDALKNVANQVKSNFKRQKADTVIAEGEPPLTMAAVGAFAEILRMAWDVNMTETEFDITKRTFIEYYNKGDAKAKNLFANGWQAILANIMKNSGEARSKDLEDVRTIMDRMFTNGANNGMPWAVAMHQAIERRKQTVASMKGDASGLGKNGELHRQMTMADLDASLEMLYFMWVAAGRDPSVVTPQTVQMVRAAIIQNFPTFPQQVQLIFANAQKFYASLRSEWANASPGKRMQMAVAFSSALDQLGLTVDTGRGGGGGSMSGMSSQAHSAWAADMVQGLAGSSYNNAWTTP